jgi:hypothetical protein
MIQSLLMIAAFIGAFAFLVKKYRHWKKGEDSCAGCAQSKHNADHKK